MSDVHEVLQAWESSLCPEVTVGGLLKRNRTAHKWKVTLRILIVRECIFWRTQDLLKQTVFLADHGHILGSRILLRSAIESVAVLVFLNQQMRAVCERTIDFRKFQELSIRLLMGSKDGSTDHAAINILTILEKCDKKFEGILTQYNSLSESAHPNFEGVCIGYSRSEKETLSTTFKNNWTAMYGKGVIAGVQLCVVMFEHEYNEEWPAAFTALEDWLVSNDAELERTKDAV